MIIYKDVIGKLKASGYNSTYILREGVIGQATMQALRHNKPVNLKTINTLCRLLKCQPGDIMEYIDDPTEE